MTARSSTAAERPFESWGDVPRVTLAEHIRKAYTRGKWALALRGILSIGIGILIFARPLSSLAVAALVIAVWALADGTASIVHAFELRPYVRHWWVLAIAGGVGITFGIAALYYFPTPSLALAVVWTTAWLVTIGVLGILLAMQERRLDLPWGWTMTLGAVAILAGFVTAVYPQFTLTTLLALFGTFAILRGILLLASVSRLQAFEHELEHAASKPAQGGAASPTRG
jgi:uncharacterized membrane protein HdeD (DUF308 family)